MKTRKILATIAAFVAAATVLSAAVLAVSLPSTHTDVTSNIDTTAPENVILPAIPASEEKTALPDISNAEPVHEHDRALGDLAWMSAIEEQAREYRQAEIARLECTHEDSLVFCDIDTGTYSVCCGFCGVAVDLDETTSDAIVTSAVIRSSCDHVFNDWVFLNGSRHVRFCQKCSLRQAEAHVRVAADCTNLERCTICNGHDSSWGVAYGHQIKYVISDYGWDGNDVYNPDVYYHEYRCARTDEDGNYICDYVEILEKCNMTPTYWEPEVNGYHEVYHICPCCLSYMPDVDVACDRYMYGDDCIKCMNPNSFD